MALAVLNGDLIGSRALGPEAPRRLAEALGEANRRFSETLAAPFEAFKGDAFQALFARPEDLPDALIWLEARLRTRALSARYGVGLGAVEGLRGGRAASPALLTGEAFLRAEAALAEARRLGAAAVVRSGRADWDPAANAALLLLGYVWRRWPPAVWRRLADYLEAGDLKAVARAEGVSYQAVHKQFASWGVREALRALERLGKGLEARS